MVLTRSFELNFLSLFTPFSSTTDCMGILKSIGDFVFGKDPDIFDENGQVMHKLPKKKWDAWHNRTKLDPQYNWRNHTGTTAGNPSNRKKT